MPVIVHSAGRRRRRWREVSDRDLLIAMRRGEDQALDELMDRKTGPLLQVAARLVGDREEARDIVQVTFLRAWQRRRTFDPQWSPNTWLYRIATNLAIDHLRARRSRARQREPVRLHLHRLADRRRRRELADLQDSEVRRILEELAAALTERQRAVFVLRELEELPSTEVARILGCRASTVRNHLFAARKVLRSELRRRYPEYAAAAPEDSGSGVTP